MFQKRSFLGHFSPPLPNNEFTLTDLFQNAYRHQSVTWQSQGVLRLLEASTSYRYKLFGGSLPCNLSHTARTKTTHAQSLGSSSTRTEPNTTENASGAKRQFWLMYAKLPDRLGPGRTSRSGLKIRFPPGSVGSSPTSGTRLSILRWRSRSIERSSQRHWGHKSHRGNRARSRFGSRLAS